MRIYAEAAAGIFQAGQMNPSMNQKHMGNVLQPAERRTDAAVISPQGRASGMLASLMNQKELIQMNKESLIKRSLDEESQTGSSGLKEQLEEYEKQLEELDRQIAAEMSKQAEHDPEKENIYRNPQSMNAPEDKSMARLTELSADADRAQTVEQARTRREGEKRVCEAELESGSAAAEHKLEKLEERERLTAQLEPVLRRFHL